eukprot:jgi/Ulvmu1/6674/UM030_0005.1
MSLCMAAVAFSQPAALASLAMHPVRDRFLPSSTLFFTVCSSCFASILHANMSAHLLGHHGTEILITLQRQLAFTICASSGKFNLQYEYDDFDRAIVICALSMSLTA